MFLVSVWVFRWQLMHQMLSRMNCSEKMNPLDARLVVIS